MVGLLVLGMVQWAFLTGVIARGKGRDAVRWGALGAVLPVIGLGIAIAAPAVPREAPEPKRRIPARLASLRPAATTA